MTNSTIIATLHIYTAMTGFSCKTSFGACFIPCFYPVETTSLPHSSTIHLSHRHSPPHGHIFTLPHGHTLIFPRGCTHSSCPLGTLSSYPMGMQDYLSHVVYRTHLALMGRHSSLPMGTPSYILPRGHTPILPRGHSLVLSVGTH